MDINVDRANKIIRHLNELFPSDAEAVKALISLFYLDDEEWDRVWEDMQSDTQLLPDDEFELITLKVVERLKADGLNITYDELMNMHVGI